MGIERLVLFKTEKDISEPKSAIWRTYPYGVELDWLSEWKDKDPKIRVYYFDKALKQLIDILDLQSLFDDLTKTTSWLQHNIIISNTLAALLSSFLYLCAEQRPLIDCVKKYTNEEWRLMIEKGWLSKAKCRDYNETVKKAASRHNTFGVSGYLPLLDGVLIKDFLLPLLMGGVIHIFNQANKDFIVEMGKYALDLDFVSFDNSLHKIDEQLAKIEDKYPSKKEKKKKMDDNDRQSFKRMNDAFERILNNINNITLFPSRENTRFSDYIVLQYALELMFHGRTIEEYRDALNDIDFTSHDLLDRIRTCSFLAEYKSSLPIVFFTEKIHPSFPISMERYYTFLKAASIIVYEFCNSNVQDTYAFLQKYTDSLAHSSVFPKQNVISLGFPSEMEGNNRRENYVNLYIDTVLNIFRHYDYYSDDTQVSEVYIAPSNYYQTSPVRINNMMEGKIKIKRKIEKRYIKPKDST